MKDPMDRLDRLAARARHDAPPAIDVALRVRVAIAELREPLERPLAFFAAGSLLAAAAVVASSWPAWTLLTDPLGAMLHIAAAI